jgi:hypothetical protein
MRKQRKALQNEVRKNEKLVPVRAIKIYGGEEAHLHSFLTTALEVSGHLQAPIYLLLEEIISHTYGIGGWVGPTTRLHVLDKNRGLGGPHNQTARSGQK